MRKKLLAIVMSLMIIPVFVPEMAFAEPPGVTSIAFTPEEPKVIYDYKLKEECELQAEGYFYSPEIIEGDSIEITYTDGTTLTYKLTTDSNDELVWANEKDPADSMPMDNISFGAACIPANAANGDSFSFEIEYSGAKTSSTVEFRSNPYTAFSFKQSDQFNYVFETDMLVYDAANDEYVLNEANAVDYAGSAGDILNFKRSDGSQERYEYGTITGDPDYPHGWSGFVTVDASGIMHKLQSEIMFKDPELRWKKDSDGHYINTTATLTYMGADANEPLVSYAGCQVWFDPNGGDGRGNMAIPIGMSINEQPNDLVNDIKPTRSGYTFDGWYEKNQAGELAANPFDFDTKINQETFLYAKWKKDADSEGTDDQAAYYNKEGDGMTWDEGSGEDAVFVFKRYVNDSETFSHFTGIMIDGKVVPLEYYKAEPGSVIIRLSSDYLNTLGSGEHTLTALFDDADSAEAVFTIKVAEYAGQDDQDDPEDPSRSETKKDKKPDTGDENNILLWLCIFGASLTGLIIAAKKRTI